MIVSPLEEGNLPAVQSGLEGSPEDKLLTSMPNTERNAKMAIHGPASGQLELQLNSVPPPWLPEVYLTMSREVTEEIGTCSLFSRRQPEVFSLSKGRQPLSCGLQTPALASLRKTCSSQKRDLENISQRPHCLIYENRRC